MGNVVMGQNIKRTKEIIDANGNVLSSLDPQKKQIVQSNKPDYVPTVDEIKAMVTGAKEGQQTVAKATVEELKEKGLLVAVMENKSTSIVQQIKDAEAHLDRLHELKKAEITKKKKELEELEKDV